MSVTSTLDRKNGRAWRAWILDCAFEHLLSPKMTEKQVFGFSDAYRSLDKVSHESFHTITRVPILLITGHVEQDQWSSSSCNAQDLFVDQGHPKLQGLVYWYFRLLEMGSNIIDSIYFSMWRVTKSIRYKIVLINGDTRL